MARIVSLGSALQDLYLIDHDDFGGAEIGGVSIFKDLKIGSKVDIDKIQFFIGGGGTNSAVTFAKNNHEAIFLGNIANDPAGKAVLEKLDEEGIDSSFVNVLKKGNTGTSVILLDSKTGERTVLTCRGVSAKFSNLSPNDLDLINPDWLYVTTLRGDMGTLLGFFEKAKSLGTKIMFNPGKLEFINKNQLLGLLKDVDILLVNREEASSLVPGVLLSELLARLKNYAKTVIITDGAMGGIATDGEISFRFGIYEDVKVKDTTGAGDAFGSGFLAAYSAGKSFRSSLIFASANSTSVVQKLGAKNGLLSLEETSLHPMPIQRI
ncbi:carbohydrate kinase family protein [Candidatus Saccharibacteria bacterium]|nr:carbohydrate kinase family protein [Candidatus Saccharibacteria bacterium]MBQ6147301.1 carbohydrate kinase family protein [Candidatus Saccharibacteria bacterium]